MIPRLYLVGGVLAIIVGLALWGFLMKTERDAARSDAITFKTIASINQKSFDHLSDLVKEQNKSIHELGEAKEQADAARDVARADATKLIAANERIRDWLRSIPPPAAKDECTATQAVILTYRLQKGLP